VKQTVFNLKCGKVNGNSQSKMQQVRFLGGLTVMGNDFGGSHYIFF